MNSSGACSRAICRRSTRSTSATRTTHTRLACLITGSRTDGEDLAQEAFVACAQSIGSLRDGAKFRPWLLRTLSRAAWKYCRKARRETPVSEFFDENTAKARFPPCCAQRSSAGCMPRSARSMEKRRVAVVLYYFDDRSVKEIAQATGRDRRHGQEPPVFRPPSSAAGADRRRDRAEGGCIT